MTIEIPKQRECLKTETSQIPQTGIKNVKQNVGWLVGQCWLVSGMSGLLVLVHPRLVGWLVGLWCTHFRDLAPLINSILVAVKCATMKTN